MKKTDILVKIILIFCILLLIFFHHKPKNQINKLKTVKNNKLMIVAHPDDDLLWGGAHLIEDDYVVVCITCNTVPRRAKEFQKVMHTTNDEFIMLGYPDKTNGKRDDWNLVREQIIADLEKIIHYKNWDLIVTHNPDGEYGHEHHKMTSQFVTSLTSSNLYYFGKYYKKENVVEAESITDESYQKKVDALTLYASQKKVIDSFEHMWKYENWIKSDRW